MPNDLNVSYNTRNLEPNNCINTKQDTVSSPTDADLRRFYFSAFLGKQLLKHNIY